MLDIMCVVVKANDEETRRARSLYGRYCVRKMVEDPDGARGFDHDDWAIDARNSMSKREMDCDLDSR